MYVKAVARGVPEVHVHPPFQKKKMPPIMANSNEGQDHKDKYFDTSRKILSQEMTMCNMEATKDLITRDIHVKYQSSSNHCSKVISKIQVLKK